MKLRNPKRKGISLERRAIQELKAKGFRAYRLAGSKGEFDIIAIGVNVLKLIQVKGNTKSRLDALRAMQEISIPAVVATEVWVWNRQDKNFVKSTITIR